MREAILRLRMAGEKLAAELAHLNDAQWRWRAGDGRWTVQENVEHLILVERGVLSLLQRAMRAPATERGEALTDEQVWEKLAGPNGRKAEAPERVRPSGAWEERLAAVAEFGRLREETLRYAESTTDPMRERWLRLPAGELDGVQTLLMLAGHTLRHLEQIRAVRAAAGFPGN
ncbi:MAG: DinB family protein [Bryobacteraceae bacterium]